MNPKFEIARVGSGLSVVLLNRAGADLLLASLDGVKGLVKFDAKDHRIGGASLLAVVTLHPNKGGRQYRIAAARDYAAVFRAMARLKKVAGAKLPNGLSPIPDEPPRAVGQAQVVRSRYKSTE